MAVRTGAQRVVERDFEEVTVELTTVTQSRRSVSRTTEAHKVQAALEVATTMVNLWPSGEYVQGDALLFTWFPVRDVDTGEVFALSEGAVIETASGDRWRVLGAARRLPKDGIARFVLTKEGPAGA